MTNRVLTVGDVHATADDLEDCEKLIDLIEEVVQVRSIDHIVFMGDQTHNHAILNVNVMDFWKRSFTRLKKACPSIFVLVGNHDLPGNTGSNDVNSMSFFEGIVTVVKDFCIVDDSFCLVGYQHRNDKFVKMCNDVFVGSGIKLFFCHQTFDGAMYENGFYAKDGIKQESFDEAMEFVSGHIHSRHSFGRIQYVGSPRWRTLSDINQEKFLDVIYPVTEAPYLDEAIEINTLRKIVSFDVHLDGPFTLKDQVVLFKSSRIGLSLPNASVVHINVYGTKEQLEQTGALSALFSKENINHTIKKFQTNLKTKVIVRESDGINQAFVKYIDGLTLSPKDHEKLKIMIEERILK